MNARNRDFFVYDNLFVLRGMDSESVDLIYLDPPFNTEKEQTDELHPEDKQKLLTFFEYLRDKRIDIGIDLGWQDEYEHPTFKDRWDEEDDEVRSAIWHEGLKDRNPKLYHYLVFVKAACAPNFYHYLCFMAIRLVEMHRILKPTGSLYLHCDQKMSHFLKLVLDFVFGEEHFLNEIIWRKTNSPKAQSKSFGKQKDSIFLYSKSLSNTFFKVFKSFDSKSLKPYSYDDNDGRGKYRLIEIEAQGLQRSKDRKVFKFKGRTAPYLYSIDKLKQWDKANLIYTSKNNRYSKKQYLSEMKGVLVSDLWTDDQVNPIQGAEHVGYPTQKPLALLARIIAASTHEGDIVLDPFAGCATTCVAAENLNRRWIGIDVLTISYLFMLYRIWKSKTGKDSIQEWLPRYRAKAPLRNREFLAK